MHGAEKRRERVVKIVVRQPDKPCHANDKEFDVNFPRGQKKFGKIYMWDEIYRRWVVLDRKRNYK